MRLRSLLRTLAVVVGLAGASVQAQTQDVALQNVPAGAFSDTYSFLLGGDAIVSGALFTTGSGRASELRSTSASLNGVADSFAGLGAIEIGGRGSTRLSGPQLGDGQRASAGYPGALSVSPVPEPGAYAMMLAGLGALAFMLRRRAPSA
ncbi:FxDxF family PEP-CTERM protein [uncultured Methylibium sp.]|uniref:FxDxF family PEP-CTERM protein n=1 Tax=uncultured Methylibium sp. TaxID=381093 RepID=UPI0025ED07DC|nr:FxDxF family PEP-CTERM protein [uncultured Methylibium sp.]